MDTTEQSSLGWTKYPDGGPQTRTPGWVEESFTNFERGINWRSFVVCDVAFNSVNNWLWTPYIERGDANRLYIEIKFTMRDCNLFPQMVLSCKETFALLYKEVDAPIQANGPSIQSAANVSFAQSDSYTLIDAIAADEGRFTSNNDVVINTEIRSIPVTKRGVYFAFRDQGACLSLISIKVYHMQCPQLTTNLAKFNATPTGRDLTSLVAVEGECVANSVQIEQPKMFCTADGQWNSMSSGQCKCLAGYEQQANGTRCQACPAGKFKWQLGAAPCQMCPERSSSLQLAASECKCHEGFYRAPKDSRSAPCTQPPGPPSNLSAVYVDSTSVILQWQVPRYTGNRDDLTYKLVCDSCDQTSLVSSPQFYANFSETKCVLSGLQPATSYHFLIYAMNGVSQMTANGLAGAQFSEIIIQTARQMPQTASNTLSTQGGFQLMPIYNFRALPGARGTDMLLAWDAQPLQLVADQLVGLAGLTGSGLALDSGDQQQAQQQPQQLPSMYEVRYQPRYAATTMADSLARRSPYPLLMDHVSGAGGQAAANQNQAHQYQSVTTTNRALAISVLQPRTEYAFQIRAKWPNSAQWTEWSEPIFMATTSQVSSFVQLDQSASASSTGANSAAAQFDTVASSLDASSRPFFQQNQITSQQQQPGWLRTFVLVLFCSLVALVLVAVTLIHYRKSMCLQSLSTGFGALGSSTYAGVYNGGASSDLMGVSVGPLGFGGATLGAGSSPANAAHLYHNGAGLHHQHQHQHQLHATMSAGSAGALITGSNSTSRSSSGAGNVVQNFIAATLNQISGHHNSNKHQQHQHHHHHTISQDGKLFMQTNGANSDSANSIQQQQPRNHYHQMLGNVNHTMLLGGQHGHFQPLPMVPSSGQPIGGQLAAGGQCHQQSAAPGDLFDHKYRTLARPGKLRLCACREWARC